MEIINKSPIVYQNVKILSTKNSNKGFLRILPNDDLNIRATRMKVINAFCNADIDINNVLIVPQLCPMVPIYIMNNKQKTEMTWNINTYGGGPLEFIISSPDQYYLEVAQYGHEITLLVEFLE